MALSPSVEVVQLERSCTGRITFWAAQSSDQTLIAELAPQQPWELFCHRHQTDQLILLRGSLDLVVLHNGRFERITLREDDPVMVRIPPGVPHGAINQGRYSATLVNAVLRHGPAAAGDYRPRPIPAGLLGQWQKLLNVPDSTAHLGLEQSGETPGRSVPGNG